MASHYAETTRSFEEEGFNPGNGPQRDDRNSGHDSFTRLASKLLAVDNSKSLERVISSVLEAPRRYSPDGDAQEGELSSLYAGDPEERFRQQLRDCTSDEEKVRLLEEEKVAYISQINSLVNGVLLQEYRVNQFENFRKLEKQHQIAIAEATAEAREKEAYLATRWREVEEKERELAEREERVGKERDEAAQDRWRAEELTLEAEQLKITCDLDVTEAERRETEAKQKGAEAEQRLAETEQRLAKAEERELVLLDCVKQEKQRATKAEQLGDSLRAKITSLEKENSYLKQQLEALNQLKIRVKQLEDEKHSKSRNTLQDLALSVETAANAEVWPDLTEVLRAGTALIDIYRALQSARTPGASVKGRELIYSDEAWEAYAASPEQVKAAGQRLDAIIQQCGPLHEAIEHLKKKGARFPTPQNLDEIEKLPRNIKDAFTVCMAYNKLCAQQ